MFKVYASSDPVSNGFSDFLLNYGVFLAIGVAVLLASLVVVLLFLHDRGNHKKVDNKNYSHDDLLEAIGGKGNIILHQRAGSRISLTLSNYKIVDEKKLNQLGVDSIIKMSNKIILVVKDDPETFYKTLTN